VISDGILLITAYKQNTGEERNKSAMKTLSLSLSLRVLLSLSLSLSLSEKPDLRRDFYGCC
jgi:hypothetical protein